MSGQAIEAGGQADRTLPGAAGGTAIASHQGVVSAQFERAKLQLPGEQIHHRFHGGGYLGDAEAAEGPGNGVVGIDGSGLQVDMGNPIRTTGVFDAECGHHAAQVVVGTGVEPGLDRQCCQCPAAAGAEPVAQSSGMPFDAGEKAFLAAPPHLGRPAGAVQRRQRQQALYSDTVFSAEGPAAKGGDDPHAIDAEPQCFGDFRAVAKRGLGGDRYLDAPFVIGAGPAVFRFEESMGLARQVEFALDDLRAAGKSVLAGADGDVGGK